MALSIEWRPSGALKYLFNGFWPERQGSKELPDVTFDSFYLFFSFFSFLSCEKQTPCQRAKVNFSFFFFSFQFYFFLWKYFKTFWRPSSCFWSVTRALERAVCCCASQTTNSTQNNQQRLVLFKCYQWKKFFFLFSVYANLNSEFNDNLCEF